MTWRWETLYLLSPAVPHVSLYHSDSVIYKAPARFSVQNQQCSCKHDNIHFRWARRRYSITCIQCLWAISHYHSLPRTEKGMEINACACFVPFSFCLPCSENNWTTQIKERVALAFCLGSMPGNLKWMSIVEMTKALVRESSLWAINAPGRQFTVFQWKIDSYNQSMHAKTIIWDHLREWLKVMMCIFNKQPL